MINLNNRQFSPVSNSDGGRVKDDAVFSYSQTGADFTASYHGKGVSDGHIIGKMTGETTAYLVYHSRAGNGDLEVGAADVIFETLGNNTVRMHLNWAWLNGTKSSGTSVYEEIS